MSLRDFLFGYLLFGYFKMIEAGKSTCHTTLSSQWCSLKMVGVTELAEK